MCKYKNVHIYAQKHKKYLSYTHKNYQYNGKSFIWKIDICENISCAHWLFTEFICILDKSFEESNFWSMYHVSA